MRPDVGTQSLAVSIDERFDTSLFTRQHAVAATAKATKAAINPAMATAPAFSTSLFFAPFLEPPLNPRSRIAWSQPASHVVSVLKVTRSNRVSVTEEALQLVDDAPTVHPQEYDTDKGGGQLYYVISAKRRHYYEYMLGDLIIYL